MAWAKFDDRFDDNRKVKRAWKAHARAVGLYSMAVTYCSRHESDGLVDAEWLHERLTNAKERQAVLDALVECGLFVPVGDGDYRVHDYLDHNPSRAELEAKRAKDRERKARGGRNGRPKDSTTTPQGFRVESNGSPKVPAQPSPAPSQPIPSQPQPGNDPLAVGLWLDRQFAAARRRRLSWASDSEGEGAQRELVTNLAYGTAPEIAASVMRDVSSKLMAGQLKSDLAGAFGAFVAQAERGERRQPAARSGLMTVEQRAEGERRMAEWSAAQDAQDGAA